MIHCADRTNSIKDSTTINNAALVNTNAPLWEIQASEFDVLTSVNINGVANVIRHFVPGQSHECHCR
jgi:NADP-dependent 3-hydroxy acid dehydrogenase YdfG